MTYSEGEGSEAREILAVYGSAREGVFNHSLIDDCPKLGMGVVHGLMLYIDAQRPIARLDARYNTVVELYYVMPERLRLVDAYEGAAMDPSGICRRMKVTVSITSKTDEGGSILGSLVAIAWCYIYHHKPSDRSRIAHGDYIRYLREMGTLEEDDLPL
jgi:gamma-glutamylcyclotransferase (GGCT)/AIG2-like uncharacterized protein YtfP